MIDQLEFRIRVLESLQWNLKGFEDKVELVDNLNFFAEQKGFVLSSVYGYIQFTPFEKTDFNLKVMDKIRSNYVKLPYSFRETQKTKESIFHLFKDISQEESLLFGMELIESEMKIPCCIAALNFPRNPGYKMFVTNSINGEISQDIYKVDGYCQFIHLNLNEKRIYLQDFEDIEEFTDEVTGYALQTEELLHELFCLRENREKHRKKIKENNYNNRITQKS